MASVAVADSLPAVEGIRAMQAINVAAARLVFLATTAGASCWGEFPSGGLGRPGAARSLLGSVAYLVGGFLVTVFFNVPMNDRLAALSPTDPDAGAQWGSYLARWTAWNDLRTVACLAAWALFTFALLARE